MSEKPSGHPARAPLAKLFTVLFLLTFIVGGAGYAVLTLIEHYAALRANLGIARKQEKLLALELERRTGEKIDAERYQLDFAGRMADQERKLKTLARERRELLDALRRVTKRNRDLTEKEEAAEKILARTGLLRAELGRKRWQALGLERARSLLAWKVKELQRKVRRDERALERELSKERARLRRRTHAQRSAMRAQVEWLREEAERSRSLAQDRERLARTVAASRALRRRERGTFYYNLGTAYCRVGMFKEAAGQFEQALALNPDDAQAHHNLGILYESHLGLRERAVEHFRRFIALTPDEKKRNEVMRWVAEADHGIGHHHRTAHETGRKGLEKLFMPNN